VNSLWRVLFAIAFGWSGAALTAQTELNQGLPPERLGSAASQADIDSRSNVIFPAGEGLPPGQGTVAQGAALYALHCVACHGREGRGGSGGELAGGNPDLTARQPDKTIGTYWPYATTLFDFVRRAMPLTAPWSLTDEETYALVAYLLNLNGIVGPEFVADAAAVRAVKMPNRNGFVPIDVALPAVGEGAP